MRAVYEFNNTGDLYHKFSLRGAWGRMTVTDSGKVLIPRTYNVFDVYKTDGQFVFSFGEDILKAYRHREITTANGGRAMVVGMRDPCVNIFSERGDHLNAFRLQGCYSCPRIAFHRESEHVVDAGEGKEKDLLHVEIYTKDGVF